MLTARAANKDYETIDPKVIMDVLAKCGLENYDKYTLNELIGVALPMAENSQMHRELISVLISAVQTARSKELTSAINDFNTASVTGLAQGVETASGGMTMLSGAITEFNEQNAQVLTGKLGDFISTVSAESKAAGLLTKVLIGISILACIVNVVLCIFTAMMAFATCDMAKSTRDSLERSEPKINWPNLGEKLLKDLREGKRN
jgi:hypothetical protein